ncbi:hypothetical protein Bca52824_094670 [Brassica carinata]|uniref:Uncharacterized protein n=1 Tax=Brassica carinata TaxID=52824 RepID=A0A8X7P363_BRACI|nr:hypothetical protein Bca52824_094670 [Brassica carinata]
MHRKLKISEYSPLLDKLNSRFNFWATKSLSFAGRCLLIKTVVTGTVNFWTSTFLLPRGCIKRIESLCSRFLWSGKTDRRATAKVSWKIVCLPKPEGGLGLRNFRLWNITLLLRLAWLLFSGSNSLWVAWHREHNCPTSYSFWSQTETQTMSWNWRCILRLRDLISRFITSNVHNGCNTSLWNGTRNLRIPIEESVSEACDGRGWRLPHPRSDMEVSLHSFLITFPTPALDRGPDSFRWETNGNSNTSFSASMTWEQETRDHLMLSCPYALVLWSEVKRRFRDTVPPFSKWSDLMQWTSSSSPTTPSMLRMMVIQALVYNIWQQRNNKLQNHTLLPPLVAFKRINRHVIDSISAARKQKKFCSLMLLWLI